MFNVQHRTRGKKVILATNASINIAQCKDVIAAWRIQVQQRVRRWVHRQIKVTYPSSSRYVATGYRWERVKDS